MIKVLKLKEEYAIVLDYLPIGYPGHFKKEPIAQAIGEDHFTLLELIIKREVKVDLRERVYIGPEKREKVQFIKGRIKYSQLTNTAQKELEDVLQDLVSKKEEQFVNFFNKAGSITVRQHSLELLPGIGKKHMWDLLAQREKKPFQSFKDISERVALMPDPKNIIVERIIEELKGDTKYYIFTRPYREHRPGYRR